MMNRSGENDARYIEMTVEAGNGVEELTDFLASLGVTELRYTELRPYIYDMPEVMAGADLVMCRSGASTLGELTAMGVPALLVPSVTHNHQESKARVLESAGAAILMLERECSGDALFEKIASVIRDGEALSKMSGAMLSLGRSDPAGLIVSEALRLMKD